MKAIDKIFRNNKGITIIEVVLILVVLIGLVIIFKSQINSLIQSIFEKINSSAKSV